MPSIVMTVGALPLPRSSAVRISHFLPSLLLLLAGLAAVGLVVVCIVFLYLNFKFTVLKGGLNILVFIIILSTIFIVMSFTLLKKYLFFQLTLFSAGATIILALISMLLSFSHFMSSFQPVVHVIPGLIFMLPLTLLSLFNIVYPDKQDRPYSIIVGILGIVILLLPIFNMSVLSFFNTL